MGENNPDWKRPYDNAKKKFLDDEKLKPKNKVLFTKFFKFQEKKLQRQNNLRQLDNSCYKTLYGYISKFKNVLIWFDYKEIEELNKKDIERVYDDLEDGKIKTKSGKPFENLEDSYYSKVFKSTLFEMAGKIEIARDVIRYTNGRNKEVRFILEDDFLKLIEYVYKPHHKVLFWLAWDIGENITSLLRLKKTDFTLQKNEYTKEPEYRINLHKDILKRSRKARGELTNYPTTVKLLDNYLKDFDDDDNLFDFGYNTAKKIFDRAVERSGIKSRPNNKRVTWKDIRSGMACDLLKKGWSTDEVNARLGHRPSSDEIDKYVNFLAIDRSRPKKKVQEFEMEKISQEMNELKQREKLQISRNEALQQEMEAMKKQQEIIYRLLRENPATLREALSIKKVNI